MQVSSFLFINGQIISVFSVRTRGGCSGPLHRKNLPNKRSRGPQCFTAAFFHMLHRPKRQNARLLLETAGQGLCLVRGRFPFVTKLYYYIRFVLICKAGTKWM